MSVSIIQDQHPFQTLKRMNYINFVINGDFCILESEFSCDKSVCHIPHRPYTLIILSPLKFIKLQYKRGESALSVCLYSLALQHHTIVQTISLF